ncbi:MAG: hypothetical protein FWD57_09010 [Polyangiaceae bacterium]|nr:hypothetical protein [Polyangiaceae bacterium]
MKSPVHVVLATLSLGFALPSCGDQQSAVTPPQTGTVLHPEGGTYIDEATGVWLVVPAGAVSAPLRVTVEQIGKGNGIADTLPDDARANGAWRLQADTEQFSKIIAIGFPVASPAEPNLLVSAYGYSGAMWEKARLLDGEPTSAITSNDGRRVWVATDHLSEWGVGTQFNFFYPDPFASDFIMLPTALFSESWASGATAFAFMHDDEARTRVYREVITEIVMRSERVRAQQEIGLARELTKAIGKAAGDLEDVTTILGAAADTLTMVAGNHAVSDSQRDALIAYSKAIRLASNALGPGVVVDDCISEIVVDLAIYQSIDFGMVRDRYIAFREMTVGSTLYEKDPAFRAALDYADVYFGTVPSTYLAPDVKVAEAVSTWLMDNATQQCDVQATELLYGKIGEYLLPALVGAVATEENNAIASMVWSYSLKDDVFQDLIASSEKALVLSALGTIWHRGVSTDAWVDLLETGATEVPPVIAYGSATERSKWLKLQNFHYLMESIRWMAQDALELDDTLLYNPGLKALEDLVTWEVRTGIIEALTNQRADYAGKVDAIARSIPSGCESPVPDELSAFCSGEPVKPGPIKIAGNLSSDISALRITTNKVYWVDEYARTIGSVDKHGGVASTIASGLDQPYRMDIVGNELYFTTTGKTAPGLWSVDVTGGAPVMVAEAILSEYAPKDVVRREGVLFYSTHSSVHRISAGDIAKEIVGDGASILRIDADADFVYWTEHNHFLLRKAPIAGGAATTLASSLMYPLGIAVDDQHVYFVETGVGVECGQPKYGKVQRIAKSGGTPTTLAFALGCDPSDIAIDDEFVYWTESYLGNVARVAKTGGVVEVLASSQDWPKQIAVDDTRVYWAAGGSIFAVPK